MERKYKLLVEQQTKDLWRVVARRLTWDGFTSNHATVSNNHPTLACARQTFKEAQRNGCAGLI